MTRSAECLVIGGGLAGSMVALRLAEAGREVMLLEKETGPHHKVCGEFLSAEAVGYLRSAGIEPELLGAAPIERLRVSTGRSVAETSLPFRALSLARCVLDERLLELAGEAGAQIQRGTHVDSLRQEPNYWVTEAGGRGSLRSRTMFLATGKHELRGWARDESASEVQDGLVGFKLHWRLTPDSTSDLRGWMELFLFAGGYGGLSLVENDVANLCLVVRRRVLRKLGGWNRLLDEILHKDELLRVRLSGAASLWPKPLAISSIPYGYIAEPQPGVWRVGDQAAVIPSFTGDGMSIALHSGALAARSYLAGMGAEVYQEELAHSLARGMRLATLLSRATVHPLARLIAPPLLRSFPGMMRWIAAQTRIPDAALLAR